MTFQRRLGVAAALLAGCQSYPFLYRANQRVAITSVREVIFENSDTDILFIVDNSGSMGEEQANLIRNTRAFVEELSKSENTYHVGVITTDSLDEGNRGLDGGRLRRVNATAARLGAAGCNIAPDTSTAHFWERPDPSDPAVDDLRCRLVEDFAATVTSLGTGGSARESGLRAARLALDPTSPVAADNAGFLRPQADLALIFLTDEDDCSFADYGTGGWSNPHCYEEASSAIPPADFVDSFASLKGTPGDVRKVRAAVIGGGLGSGESAADFVPRGCRLAGSDPSGICGCWSSSDDAYFCTYLQGFGHPCTGTAGCLGPPGAPGVACAATPGSTCDTPRCDALPDTRYHEFLRRLRQSRLGVGFSAGTFEDTICQAEYDATLLTIVRSVVLSDCFILDQPALGAGAVQVTLRRTDPLTGAHSDAPVPRYDATDPTADCRDCGTCPDGAWRYVDERTMCLDCGLRKLTGDEFLLTVFNEIYGIDGGPR